MANRDRIDAPSASQGRIAREVERERHERTLHDQAKAGLATPDDFRTKDARERDDTSNLRRHQAR
jgi:hypothetical protein